MELNEDQVTAILVESMNRGIYECPNNTIPENKEQRTKDAEDIVNLCVNARKNGNRSDNVASILFIAESDLSPSMPVQVQLGNVNQKPPIAQDSPEPNVVDGFDITQVTDGILDSLILGLDKYPQNEQVQRDREIYLAEKARRAGEGSKEIQEIAQGTPPQEANEKAGEIATEGPAPTSALADQAVGGGGGRADSTGSNRESPAADTAQSEDAGAFARAQTPETSPEGKQAKAKPVEEDAERAEVEAKLTLPAVKAHGVDILSLSSIPTSQLKFIVENPNGPPSGENSAEEINKVPIDEQLVEKEAIPTDGKAGKSIGGITLPEKAPEVVVSKADLGLENVEEEVSATKSEERDKLESLITGLILKAYGRGRKEIPIMGDNELRFMILNPDGKVSPEELQAAKDKDITPAQTAQKDVEDDLTEVTLPSGQKIRVKLPISEENDTEADRTIAQAAKDIREQLAEENPPVVKSSVDEVVEIINDNKVENISPIIGSGVTLPLKDEQQSRAMEIISGENFPIPPSYRDEEAPILPVDVSVISRDELFSLHAKFHAYESRMLWIMCQEEDTLGDVEKLRKNREAIVAASVPFLGEDGKRNTNERRDSIVAADSEVLDLGMKEHEIRKVVKRLKILCDNYHRDCERLSRQMSKYERERLDAPR